MTGRFATSIVPLPRQNDPISPRLPITRRMTSDTATGICCRNLGKLHKKLARPSLTLTVARPRRYAYNATWLEQPEKPEAAAGTGDFFLARRGLCSLFPVGSGCAHGVYVCRRTAVGR